MPIFANLHLAFYMMVALKIALWVMPAPVAQVASVGSTNERIIARWIRSSNFWTSSLSTGTIRGDPHSHARKTSSSIDSCGTPFEPLYLVRIFVHATTDFEKIITHGPTLNLHPLIFQKSAVARA
jgi:hypothetical protein